MIIVGQKELYDWLESGVICGNESKTLSLWIDEAGGGIVEIFLSYFAIGLKQRSLTLVWVPYSFGGEVGASPKE